MPRYRRMMDYRMSRDGRNPYGAAGGYVTSGRRRRGRRGDRGMDGNYGYDERGMGYRDYGDMQYDSRRNDYAYSQQDNARNRSDYESMGQSDMGYGSYGMRGRDGHYPMGQGGGQTYYPIEAMGVFNGYYGMGEQDYAYDMARGGRGGRGRDRGYDYDYGYDYAGDYGETLGKEEISEFSKRLLKEVEEKDKHFFSKENISQRAKQLGVQMNEFTEDELAVATLMMYTDYCMTMKPLVGSNMDIYIKLARDFLMDKDASVKGGEKLAVYYDCIVEGEE